MKASLNIIKLIDVDETGMPQKPNIAQLQDKDILLLFSRDKSRDKEQYIKECGVIYWLGDPKSPANQQGLSPDEALKSAIDNYDLPKDYVPDALVAKLITKYHKQNITEAGTTLEALRQSIHLTSKAAVKINELLNKKLTNAMADADIAGTLSLINEVKSTINSIPAMTKALATAYENLQAEEEQQYARGGVQILSSMNADED